MVSAAPLTVSQLAARIDGALKERFSTSVRFVGEVSGFRDRTHWYFDLKDASAVVNCVVFQSVAKRLGFVPQNGQQVLAGGRVEFYAAGGKVSVILDRLEPIGAGALELAYRALVEELRGLGWFAPERKRPLPVFPRRIAVVTSRTGAALQDVLVTMKKRCPAVDVLVVDCRVQGAAAAPEVAEAVRYLSEHAAELGIDAVLVTRGGGSMEDLWAFNDRSVAEAIVNCMVPVVAAIGHETDTTIAELAADERCATPTQAAMRLTPDAAGLQRQIDSIAGRLHVLLSRELSVMRRRLEAAAQRPMFTDAARVLTGPFTALEALERRLGSASRHRVLDLRARLERLGASLERHRPGMVQARLAARLGAAEASLHHAAASLVRERRALADSLERQLSAVGPMQVLERGFSITLNAQGGVVRGPADVRDGEVIETRLAGGRLRSVVGEVRSEAAVSPARLAPRQKRSRGGGSPQPGLFGG